MRTAVTSEMSKATHTDDDAQNINDIDEQAARKAAVLFGLGGETNEQTADDPMEDAPEWAKELAEDIENLKVQNGLAGRDEIPDGIDEKAARKAAALFDLGGESGDKSEREKLAALLPERELTEEERKAMKAYLMGFEG